MAKRKEKKAKWKNYIFTLRGADRAVHSIKYGDDGFLHLCQRMYDGDYLHEYEIRDRTFRPGDGGRNVAIDWTGFDEAVRRYNSLHPPKPSVFSGPYQHCQEGRELRRRLLHAACREYQHPEALADDLWEFIRHGKEDEAKNLLSILVLYYSEPKQRPECRTVAVSDLEQGAVKEHVPIARSLPHRADATQ